MKNVNLLQVLTSLAMNSTLGHGKLRRILANRDNTPATVTLPAGRFEFGGIYRTKNGRGYYQFEFHKVNGIYEIDIKNMPSYGQRDDNEFITHRYESPRGGHMICIAEEHLDKVRTLDDAIQIACFWAEVSQVYIEHGYSIDTQLNQNAN